MNYNLLKISSIILSLGVILGTFLPWAIIKSETSLLGFESNYYQSTLGIEHPYGILTIILGGICLLVAFLARKWILIPGLVGFAICLVVVVGIGKMTYVVSSNIGYAYAGTGVGVYISMLACLGITIIGVLSLIKPSVETVKMTSDRPQVESTYSPIEVVPAPNKEDWKMIGKICAISGVIVIAILGGGYSVEKILNYIDRHQNQKLNQNNNDSQDSGILTESDSLNMVDYDALANKMKREAEREADSLELIRQMSERINQKHKEETFQRDFDASRTPSEFPFEAMVTSPKCYLYSEPNVNSERKAVILLETDLSVMASQNQFFFCSYQDSTGKDQTGWIYFSDVGR